MLEKLRTIGEAAKQVILFIVTPLAFIAGVIYYLVSRNKDLERKLSTTEVERDLAARLERIEERKREANESSKEAISAEDAYRAIRDKYLNSGDKDE